MEEERQECNDTPSVTARLSAVSLKDVEEPQGKLQRDTVSSSFASAMEFSSLSTDVTLVGASDVTCVCAPHLGVFHATRMDAPNATTVVSDVAFVGASQATCMNVSDATTVVGHATQQEASATQGHDKGNGPCWAEMLPDALVKIFNHLPLECLLCTIPCVCQTWRFVSQYAPCWQCVDLSEWSYGKQPKTLERMLLLVVNRSRGCLQELCVPNLKSDSVLRLIADSGSQLQVLQIADSFVSEECLCEVALKFATLTYLDLSGRFPSRALIESFGKNCPFIIRLNLNMRLIGSSSCKSCDVAALSVAQYMPQLKVLEMAYGLLSNVGLKAVLENCRSLEHLDLRGCWHVDMEDATILNARRRIKVFLSPVVEDDIYDISDVDYNDDNDDPLDYDEYDLEYDDDFMYENVEYFDEVNIENMDEDDNF